MTLPAHDHTEDYTDTSLSPDPERIALEAQVQSAARWFYWIVGLSLVNSLTSLVKLDWGFAMGLGATAVIDYLVTKANGAGKGIALALMLLPLGFYALMGYLTPRFRAALVVGMIFYAIDSLIFIVAKDWIGIAVHAYVLFVLGKGFVAAGRLKQL